jgi:UDP-glucose 4-epimerase
MVGVLDPKKTEKINRLTGNLRVDSSHIRDGPGWRPLVSLDAGLACTAKWKLTKHPVPAG